MRAGTRRDRPLRRSARRRQHDDATAQALVKDRPGDRCVHRDDEKAGQPYSAERGRRQGDGWFHCDAPSNAHGPPRLCHDRAASATTHRLGNTTMAASDRWSVVTGVRSSRCTAQPHGTHSAPIRAAMPASRGPALGSSQYCVASTKPPRPHHARDTALPRRDAARHTISSQRNNAHPRQPPPGRRGKGEGRQRTEHQRGRAARARAVSPCRAHQAMDPGTPLNGPTTRLVIQPP